jgi:4-hydroxy-3-polyprenylbenzoate decarboxylase
MSKNFKSLREFLEFLEKEGDLVKINKQASLDLEITEISKRVLESQGKALYFENATRVDGEPAHMPVLTNLFGAKKRVAQALGLNDASEIRKLGEFLAFLKQPEPPKGLKEGMEFVQRGIKTITKMKPKTVSKAECQEVVITGDDVDLNILPIQKCWPNDVSPLITWPLVVTQGPDKKDKEDNYNLGIYRMQPLSDDSGKSNKAIMRWLHHRGGAQHHKRWKDKKPQDALPVAAVLGADPATTLAAVTPIPDNVSEYEYSGLLRNSPVELVDCKTIPLKVPANAEIVIEGYVSLEEYADEGPFGDHTGFYNSVEKFPVFNISAITHRKNPIYHTTFTGKPPDECSVLGEAMNELFIPLLQQQFPEISDFWLPPEACSYRVAVISIKKSYAGHAKRVMMGAWSYLRQFMYTKYIIIVDEKIDCRDWKEVIWAISVNTDPARDTTILENTPIDYLDFASEESGLGGKLAIDATSKIYPETKREWGEEIAMSEDIIAKVTKNWSEYNID